MQGGLIGPAVKQFGERKALLVELLFAAAGFVVYGAAPTGKLFLLGVPLMAPWPTLPGHDALCAPPDPFTDIR